MSHRLTIISVASVLCVATACGAGTSRMNASITAQPTSATANATPTPSAADVNSQRDWVAISREEVDFLRWMRTGPMVSGSLTSTLLSNADAGNLVTRNSTFVGVINGRSLSLTFPRGFEPFDSVRGALEGNNIVLSFPQSTGKTVPLKFVPGTAVDFKTGAQALQDNANGNAEVRARQSDDVAQLSASASASAASAAAHAQQGRMANAVDASAAALANDYRRLLADTANLASGSGPQQQLAQAAADLAYTQRDAAAVAEEAHTLPPGNFEMCADARRVCSDASGVARDTAGLQVSVEGARGKEVTARLQLARVTVDVQNLQQAQDAIPGYDSGSTTLSPQQITVAQNAAVYAIRQADQTNTAIIAHGNDLLQQAQAAAAAAITSGGC